MRLADLRAKMGEYSQLIGYLFSYKTSILGSKRLFSCSFSGSFRSRQALKVANSLSLWLLFRVKNVLFGLFFGSLGVKLGQPPSNVSTCIINYVTLYTIHTST